jgi:hypothetical protein
MATSSQPVAGVGVAYRHREQAEREGDHHHVDHGILLETVWALRAAAERTR